MARDQGQPVSQQIRIQGHEDAVEYSAATSPFTYYRHANIAVTDVENSSVYQFMVTLRVLNSLKN